MTDPGAFTLQFVAAGAALKYSGVEATPVICKATVSVCSESLSLSHELRLTLASHSQRHFSSNVALSAMEDSFATKQSARLMLSRVVPSMAL